jgi:uncharacterized protein (UPF0210 family)
MKIRSITFFLKPSLPFEPKEFQMVKNFFDQAIPLLNKSGYEVQTSRLATSPFSFWLMDSDWRSTTQRAIQLETTLLDIGIHYLSLGPALPHLIESYSIIPEILSSTKNTFLSGIMTIPEKGISLPAVKACAQIIHAASTITLDGFTNLRFAALANAPAGTPFFPAAFHDDTEAGFAFATESADLTVEAFRSAGSLAEARQLLIQSIEAHAVRLAACGEKLAGMTGVAFKGIDFTPAPFPEIELSLGTALECLGVPALGRHGSLAAAAFLTSALDQAHYPRTGFNGLMLPDLEDATVAKRSMEGVLSIKDLLLFSAVCGTGLDTVPLPGDTNVEQLYALLLDVACLAQRLDKPLTARLMPIPGKQAGEPTDFDFAFFAPGKILALDAEPLHGLLAGDEGLQITQGLQKTQEMQGFQRHQEQQILAVLPRRTSDQTRQ